MVQTLVHLEESRTAQAGLFLKPPEVADYSLRLFSPKVCLPPHEGLRGPARLLIHSLLPFGLVARTTLGYYSWPEYPEALAPKCPSKSFHPREPPRAEPSRGEETTGACGKQSPRSHQEPGPSGQAASAFCSEKSVSLASDCLKVCALCKKEIYAFCNSGP